MIYKNIPKKFYPRFEIVSCYVEFNDKILLLRRHRHKSEGNRWGVPAGKINEGEDKLKAVIREIKEETGQEISPQQLEYLTKIYVKYPEYHFVYHMFRTKLDLQPDITMSSNEHRTYRWVSPKKALKLGLVRELDRCIKIFYEVEK